MEKSINFGINVSLDNAIEVGSYYAVDSSKSIARVAMVCNILGSQEVGAAKLHPKYLYLLLRRNVA